MRSILNKLFAVSLVLGLGVSSVSAAELLDDIQEINPVSWKNFYLLGSLGYANFNHDETDIQPTLAAGQANLLRHSSDDNDFAYRVGVGYRINEVFAAELAYTDLGSPVSTTVNTVTPPNTVGVARTASVDNEYDEIVEIAALARFQVPELSSVAPFLRVGGFAYDGQTNDGFWVQYGAGVEWNNLRLEYIRYEFEPEAVDTAFLSVALPLSLFAR